jgi:major membrane immunogen (membrane-anchored lipoprotein)
VRFIIEKQNSLLKNKKALENIRNSQAGHILVDYRICCAMSNFCMKLCIPNGNDTIEIAKRLKKRSLKKQNKLGPLLMMTLPDFKSLPVTDMTSIDDFPQLTLSDFQRKITLGSFKVRQSRSSIEQIIKNGTVYLLNEQQIIKHQIKSKIAIELEDTKIMAVFIVSRHKRGKKINKYDTSDSDPKNFTSYYKVFIHYKPSFSENDANSCDNIKSMNSYFCL